MSDKDKTEDVRRALVANTPAELRARVEAGERVWNTEEMQAEFDTLGFMAPFVAVRRRADGKKGTLMFIHTPRFYFGWQED